ncbi:MAG TPA: amidohydrolase family protein [Candidatus Polarisedimenticolia bacterium]|nr:amidohydrolase family protein [Candidatus Polarisedimenticolia bacterium]
MSLFSKGCLALAVLAGAAAIAATPDGIKPYVREDAGVLVLDHVRVIDGTGAPAAEDQRIDIEGGTIVRVQSAQPRRAYPAGAKVLDLTGRTVIPGLVGMHEHLFYPTPKAGGDGLPMYGEMADSAPRLYLAGGVTTARTAGSMEPYVDLALKKRIDAGERPGPKLRVTAPYLGDLAGLIPQFHTLSGADNAGRMVDYWAEEGATSFKAFMSIKRDELRSVLEHAHARGLKVTGHLCAVGFREAAALGIDNLEHGIIVDTEFFPGKKPDDCPVQEAADDFAKRVAIDGAPVQELIRDLVARHVAVTSTLAVFEALVPNRPPMSKLGRVERAMTTEAWADYLKTRGALAQRNAPEQAIALKKEMQFEREFVRAGGLLLAGCDPTGIGGVLPGYGDQRGLELLVEAGFTPVEAIRIATLNGATFLGEERAIGSIAAGKAADLVVVAGNPAKNIDDVEKVETVFKDGIGYDPAKLIRSVEGLMGLR